MEQKAIRATKAIKVYGDCREKKATGVFKEKKEPMASHPIFTSNILP